MLEFVNAISPAWQTVLIIFGPILFRKLFDLSQHVMRKRSQGQEEQERQNGQSAFAPLEKNIGLRRTRLFRLSFTIVAVLLHVFWALWFPPPNLFLRLNLPLNASTTLLRNRLEHVYAQSKFASSPSSPVNDLPDLHHGTIPDSLLLLITRLSTFDNRLIYAKMGHYVLTKCDFCSSPIEYLFFLIPKLLGQYSIFLSIVGLLTMSDGRQRWRRWIMTISFLFLSLELYIRWDGWAPGFMVDSNAHLLRHLFFAVCTICAYFLPGTNLNQNPNAEHVTNSMRLLLQQQQGIYSRLRAISLQRITLLRDEQLRKQVVAFWEEAEQEGKYAQENQSLEIQQIKEKLINPSGSSSDQLSLWMDSVLEPLNAT